MDNDQMITLTCFSVLLAFVVFSIWVLFRDVRLRQPGPPKWFRLLRSPIKIVFGILSKLAKMLVAVARCFARCVRSRKVHVEEEGSAEEELRGPPWTRHKFAVRRQLYSLERRLKDEVEFDPKSSKLLSVPLSFSETACTALGECQIKFRFSMTRSL
eukprot:493720-Rhodomonas_salina.2